MRLSDENWQNWVIAFIDRANEVIIVEKPEFLTTLCRF
jgi:hypothetical protein